MNLNFSSLLLVLGVVGADHLLIPHLLNPNDITPQESTGFVNARRRIETDPEQRAIAWLTKAVIKISSDTYYRSARLDRRNQLDVVKPRMLGGIL